MAREKGAPRLFATRWPQLTDFLKELEQKGVIAVQIDPNSGTHVMLAEASKKVGSVKRARTAEEQAVVEKIQQDQWYKLQEKRVREAEENAQLVLQRASGAQHQDGLVVPHLALSLANEEEDGPNEGGFSIDLKTILQESNQTGVEPAKSSQAQQVFGMLGKRMGGLAPINSTLDPQVKSRNPRITAVGTASKGPFPEEEARSAHQLLASNHQMSNGTQSGAPIVAEEVLPVSKHKGWVCKHIVLQIHDKTFAEGKYYKQKGRVRRVAEDVYAEVEVLDMGDVVRVHQDFLKIVVPSIGRKVIVLKHGPHRKQEGTLLAFDSITKQATVLLEIPQEGAESTNLKVTLEYGEFSKKYEG